MAAAVAQASAEGSQGGPSNLQRFRAHHPPTFIGGGDPMVADHWFMQIENVLEAMEITSDTTRIRLAAFQLEGEARVWWRWVKTSRDLEVMTWAEFRSCSWVVLSRDCEEREGSGIPRAEAGGNDCDGLCG